MKITNENALRIAAAMAQLDLRIGSHFCALENPTDKDFTDMWQLAINFDLPELAAQFHGHSGGCKNCVCGACGQQFSERRQLKHWRGILLRAGGAK